MVSALVQSAHGLAEEFMEIVVLMIGAWLPIIWVLLTLLVCYWLWHVPAGQYGPWRRVWFWATLGSGASAPLWLRNALIISGVEAHESSILQWLLSYPVRIALTNLTAFSYLMCPVEAYRIFRRRRSTEAEYTPVAQVVIDANGVIISWNAEATALLGWDAAEVLNKNLPDVMIPADMTANYEGVEMPAREAHRLGLQRFYATGKGTMLGNKFKTKAQHKDGRQIDVEILVNAHTTDAGQTFQAQIFPVPPQIPVA